MLAGFKLVGLTVVAATAFGAFVGVLVGAVASDYLLWVPALAAGGLGMGVALGYGFLPER
jgi:Na+/citrate or Na+/malate symporter